MNNPGIIMHDGNFGADWVNITRGPDLIARVAYQHDGSQRDIARRIVWSWNNIDCIQAEHVAVQRAGRAMMAAAGTPKQTIATLAECLRDIRSNLEPGMQAQEVAEMLVKINKALHHVK